MNGYLDRTQPIDIHVNSLPHWQQKASTLFLTWRLGDALPAAVWKKWLQERDDWIRIHPQPWDDLTEREYHQKFSRRLDHWLDRGTGSCILRDPDYAEQVSDAILRESGFRGTAQAFVVMPNHVHLIFTLYAGTRLEALMKSIKGRSARKVNQLQHKQGTLWQPGYWDRIIRGEQHFERCRRYIVENPVKARLGKGQYLLWME